MIDDLKFVVGLLNVGSTAKRPGTFDKFARPQRKFVQNCSKCLLVKKKKKLVNLFYNIIIITTVTIIITMGVFGTQWNSKKLK